MEFLLLMSMAGALAWVWNRMDALERRVAGLEAGGFALDHYRPSEPAEFTRPLVPAADIISALYDLTPAEARVARSIAQGYSPAEVARQLNLSSETIRSQLKRVFAKTSTKRQSELSLLISRLS